MYHFLRSKKGFTVMELFTCIIVLGILCAVAVPIFSVSLKKQKINECNNNLQMMTTVIQEAMYGMMDNGKKQEFYVVGTGYGREPNSKWYVSCTDDGTLLRDADGNVKASHWTHIPNGNGKCYFCNSTINSGTKMAVTAMVLDSKGHLAYWKNTDGFCNEDVGWVYGNPFSCNNTYCYKLCYNADQCVTLGDIRCGYRPDTYEDYNDGCNHGYFLKKQALADVKMYEYFANGEIPVCPFSKDESNPVYYVMGDGTVICGCKECAKAKHDEKFCSSAVKKSGYWIASGQKSAADFEGWKVF